MKRTELASVALVSVSIGTCILWSCSGPGPIRPRDEAIKAILESDDCVRRAGTDETKRQACLTDPDRLKVAQNAYGYRECERFAHAAETVAGGAQITGWIFGIVGATAVIAGPAMGPGDQTASWYLKNRNVEVTALGGILLAVARAWIQSSNDSAVAAGVATKAMSGSDNELAYQQCLAARATWIEARQAANADLPGSPAPTDAGVSADRLRPLTSPSDAHVVD